MNIYRIRCADPTKSQTKWSWGWLVLVPLLATALALHADEAVVGSNAPAFRVQSGDDSELTLNMLRGKVIVMFYETRSVVEKNRRLKDELNRFYAAQSLYVQSNVVRLAIVNCSGAIWPFTGIWKCKLREHSKKEGITIFGDWDGCMFCTYCMKDDDCNLILIDKKGVIRYARAGFFDDVEIQRIKKLIEMITLE